MFALPGHSRPTWTGGSGGPISEPHLKPVPNMELGGGLFSLNLANLSEIVRFSSGSQNTGVFPAVTTDPHHNWAGRGGRSSGFLSEV